MPHNDYVRPGGQWFDSSVPTACDLERLDAAAAQSIDSREGGSWAPRTPIVIGGAGLRMMGGAIQGGVTTRRGGRLRLGDNDYPLLSPPRTRTTTLALADARYTVSVGALANLEVLREGVRVRKFGLALSVLIPAVYLHHGATLRSAVLHLRIGRPHSSIPSFLPSFGVFRADAAAGADSLLGGGLGLQPLATPASPAAYFQNGAPQRIVLTTNQANLIDTSAYSYAVTIADENSSGSREIPLNVYSKLTFEFTNIGTLSAP